MPDLYEHITTAIYKIPNQEQRVAVARKVRPWFEMEGSDTEDFAKHTAWAKKVKSELRLILGINGDTPEEQLPSWYNEVLNILTSSTRQQAMQALENKFRPPQTNPY